MVVAWRPIVMAQISDVTHHSRTEDVICANLQVIKGLERER